MKVFGILSLLIVVLLIMACSHNQEFLSADCDPAYPNDCIPSPPPVLNCDDIEERRFVVVPPDPHGFDGDGDGIGCERFGITDDQR